MPATLQQGLLWYANLTSIANTAAGPLRPPLSPIYERSAARPPPLNPPGPPLIGTAFPGTASPYGSKMAKIHWKAKKRAKAPAPTMVPDTLHDIDFMVRNSKRFADSGNWGYAQTPGEGVRCACIGVNNCSEMKKSDSCKSDPECDKGDLGAIICSCKAARTAKAGGRPM